jgi:integrase
MALGYKDFDTFGRWYNAKRLRETGRPASVHTLRTKQVHLAQVANMGSPKEQEFLRTSCSSRKEGVFLLDRLLTRMTPGAARVAVYALLDYAEFLVARGDIEMGILTKADVPPKNPMPSISVYSELDMENFVSAARGVDVRWWAFMAYLVDTGRRIGETLSLRWDYFRLDGAIPYVELPSTKAGEPQYVPLTARLTSQVFTPQNILRMQQTATRKGSAPNVGDYRTQPFPWSYNVARARFSRFCDRAGLPDKGFHCFRHSVITHRLAAGVPMHAVSSLAGHRNVGTTDSRYNHTNALMYAGFVERTEQHERIRNE